MTVPAARQAPAPPRPTALPVHLAWVAPGAFVAAVVLWNGGAYTIDGSSLADPSVGFGYTFGTGIASAVLGLPVGVLLTVPGCVALVRGAAPPAGLKLAAWVSGLAALGVSLLGVGSLSSAASGAGAAELVFGLLTLAAAGVLLVPAYVVVRALGAPAGC